jgi:hypothetical protein
MVSPCFYEREKHPPSPWKELVRAAPMTLSLWEDLKSVVAYAYQAIHGDVLRKARSFTFVQPPYYFKGLPTEQVQLSDIDS